jgi:hypothetical protein
MDHPTLNETRRAISHARFSRQSHQSCGENIPITGGVAHNPTEISPDLEQATQGKADVVGAVGIMGLNLVLQIPNIGC